MPSLSCAPIQTAFCSMLTGFLDQGLDFLNKVQRLLNPTFEAINLNLGKISIDLSKLNTMTAGIGNFELPNFSTDCLSMLATSIENCPYLSEHSLLSDLSGLVNTLDKYLKLDLDNSLRSLLPEVPGLPTEIDIALDINLAFNLCLDLKLDSLIPDMSKLFSCMSSFCPNSNISSRQSQLNSLMSNMNLSATGNLNISGMLGAAGASSEEIAAFNTCNNALVAKQAAITAAVQAGAETARTTVIPTTGDKYLTGDFDCNCSISSLLSVQVIDCSAIVLIETSTKACLSPCAICETSISGILGIEMDLIPSMTYINSYVASAILTLVESGPIALTSDIGVVSFAIGVLDIS